MQLETLDKAIRRISCSPGVFAVIVTDEDGIPLRTTIDQTSTVYYVSRMSSIYKKCLLAIREVDPTNHLEMIRISSRRYEIFATLAAPGCIILVIQNVLQKDIQS